MHSNENDDKSSRSFSIFEGWLPIVLLVLLFFLIMFLLLFGYFKLSVAFGLVYFLIGFFCMAYCLNGVFESIDGSISTTKDGKPKNKFVLKFAIFLDRIREKEVSICEGYCIRLPDLLFFLLETILCLVSVFLFVWFGVTALNVSTFIKNLGLI